MKSFRLLFILLCPVLFFGCKKEKSFEKGSGTTYNAEWEFTEANNLFKGKMDTAYVEEFAGINVLFLEGTSNDGKGFLNISIPNINLNGPGVYKTPNVIFDYSRSAGVLYENDLSAVNDFTLEVTEIDSNGLKGIFSGKVKDSVGAAKTITNGKFSAKLHRSTTTGNGQLTFWAKASCTSANNITVTLSNSQTGTISSFTATAPACGASGTASFTLPAGTYNWKAKCGSSDSTAGVITVAANQCARQEVTFGGAPVTGQVSFWSKNSCAGGPINVTINNQTQAISSFVTTAPANCATTGMANFTLPPGNYNWKARCAGDSLTGVVQVTANGCVKTEVAFTQSTAAQFLLVSTGGNCSSTQLGGTYIMGKPLGDTNFIVVQVNVTSVGAYNLTTNTMNGFSFSATGTFSTTGVQTVTLRGTGTPQTATQTSFLVTGGASSCSFVIPVINPPAAGDLNTWSFTQGSKTYSGTLPDGGWFDDDFLGFGKSLDLFGEIPNTDTLFDLYIQFPASATQPIPGTYVTNTIPLDQNTNEFILFDDANQLPVFASKNYLAAPVNTPVITIIITSYDATTKIVRGTFSGQAYNATGAVVSITNGKFAATVQF